MPGFNNPFGDFDDRMPGGFRDPFSGGGKGGFPPGGGGGGGPFW